MDFQQAGRRGDLDIEDVAREGRGDRAMLNFAREERRENSDRDLGLPRSKNRRRMGHENRVPLGGLTQEWQNESGDRGREAIRSAMEQDEGPREIRQRGNPPNPRTVPTTKEQRREEPYLAHVVPREHEWTRQMRSDVQGDRKSPVSASSPRADARSGGQQRRPRDPGQLVDGRNRVAQYEGDGSSFPERREPYNKGDSRLASGSLVQNDEHGELVSANDDRLLQVLPSKHVSFHAGNATPCVRSLEDEEQTGAAALTASLSRIEGEGMQGDGVGAVGVDVEREDMQTTVEAEKQDTRMDDSYGGVRAEGEDAEGDDSGAVDAQAQGAVNAVDATREGDALVDGVGVEEAGEIQVDVGYSESIHQRSLRRRSTKMMMGERVSLRRSVVLPRKDNPLKRLDSTTEKLKMVSSDGRRVTFARASDGRDLDGRRGTLSTDLNLFQQLQGLDVAKKGEIQATDLLQLLNREKALVRQLNERNKVICLLILAIVGGFLTFFGTAILATEVTKETRVTSNSVLSSAGGDTVQTNSAEFTVIDGQLRPRDVVISETRCALPQIDTGGEMRRLESGETTPESADKTEAAPSQALQTALALVGVVLDVRLSDKTLRNCVSIDLPQMHAQVLAFYRVADNTAECQSKAIFMTTLGNFTLQGTTLVSPLSARLQNVMGRFYHVEEERIPCSLTFAYMTELPDWASLGPLAYTMEVDHPCAGRCQTNDAASSKPGVVANKLRELRHVLFRNDSRIVVSLLPNHPLQHRVRIIDEHGDVTSFQVFNGRRWRCYTVPGSSHNITISPISVERNLRRWRLAVEGAKMGELWSNEDTTLPHALQWQERTMPDVSFKDVRTLTAEDAVAQWEAQYIPAQRDCLSGFVPMMGDPFSEVFVRWYDEKIQSYGTSAELALAEQWPGTSFKTYWLSVPPPKTATWAPMVSAGLNDVHCTQLDAFATKALGFGLEKCTKIDSDCFVLNVVTEPSNTKIHAAGGIKVCPTTIKSDLELTFWPKRCVDTQTLDNAFIPHLQSFGIQVKVQMRVDHNGRGSVAVVAPPGSPCHCPPCAPDAGSTLTMDITFGDLRGNVNVQFDVHIEVDVRLPGKAFGFTWTSFAHSVLLDRIFESPSSEDGDTVGDECSDHETCVAVWGDRFPTCIDGICQNECYWTERPMVRWTKDYVHRSASYYVSAMTPRAVSRFATLQAALRECAAEIGCKGVSALWSDVGEMVSFAIGSGSLTPSASHVTYVKGPNCQPDDLPPVSVNISAPSAPSVTDMDTATTALNQAITSGAFPFLTSKDDIATLTSDQKKLIKEHIEAQLR
eukprot:GEMP01000796.1.p1 GENE.GEMP01000796.1~~GEMP01000796.1.p1  ORF type:complete len:1306 (+),score=319.00 GEMP01000796.1:304-4221(+)